MQTIQERAKEHFPAVLVTLISIFQALALELLWGRVRDSPQLFEGGLAAWIGWAQALVVLLGVLVIWITYTSLVMRFRWVPRVPDMVVPFGIGLLEFALVDLMGPASTPAWLVVFAATYAATMVATHVLYRRARAEPENVEFFRQVEPATWRDFRAEVAVLLVLLAASPVSARLEGWGVFELCLFVAMGATLLRQLDLSRRFWNRMLAAETAGRPPESSRGS